MAKKWLILLLILLSANSLFAQVCSTSFKKITRACVESKQPEMGDLFATLKEAAGFIYLYKDSRKNLGKLHIHTVVNNTPKILKNKKFKNTLECTAYYKQDSFNGGSKRFVEGSLNIKFDHGSWGERGLDISGNGLDDIVLKEKNGFCLLESVNGAQFKAYKKIKTTFKGQGSQILFYTIFFLVGLAVFLVAFQVFQDNSRYQASETLEDGGEEKPQNRGIILKYSRPFFKRYFSPIVSGMKGRKKIKEKYKRELATAGLTKELPPEDFFAWKLFLIVGFPVLFLAIRTFIEADWGLSNAFFIGILGYFYPNIWLGGQIKNRQEEIIMNMPFVVDMLALSIESGLDFVAAIAKVIEKAPPSALVDEFETVLKEIRLGSSRTEALRQFSWRNNSISVASFSATLVSADSVGASIGPILKVLGAEMRGKRSAEIEKKAAAAATKMLLPMMMFILPAIIIVIMAPMVLQLFAG